MKERVCHLYEYMIGLLCQLNADAEGKEPDDAHYSEGKQILGHADISILAHRADKGDSDFLLKITKNRHGKPDRLTLHFNGAYQRFIDPTLMTSNWVA